MKQYKYGDGNASHSLYIFSYESEFFMRNEITKQQKLQSIASQCKDLELMNSMISQYQSSTKSAVEHILNMCVAVSEISKKYKAKEINDFDMMYFCSQVNLDRKSPTFRKYRQIGEYAHRFVHHVNTLPSAYTVLFQITTLDPDKFEEMIENDQITPSLSLEKFKELTNTSTKTFDPDDVHFKVEFNMKRLSDASKEFLKRTLKELMTLQDIDTVIPRKHQPTLSYGRQLKKAN